MTEPPPLPCLPLLIVFYKYHSVSLMQTQDDPPPTPSTTRPDTPGGISIKRIQTSTSAYFSTYESPINMSSAQLPMEHAQDHTATPSPKCEEKIPVLDEPTAFPADVITAPPTDVVRSITPTPIPRQSIEEPSIADGAPVNGTAQPPVKVTSSSPPSTGGSTKIFSGSVDENEPIATQPDSELARHATGAFAEGAAITVSSVTSLVSFLQLTELGVLIAPP